ncbi:MAG: ATP-binding protein, partial [Bacteroidota bacterium]
EMHYRKKEYAQCLANLNKAEEFLGSYDNAEIKRDLYFDFSTLYSDMGDAANSLKYYRLYDQMKDSLFMEDKNSKIDELKIFYDTEDKIRENEILKKDNAISKLEINKQQNITYFLVIISVFVIILLIVLVGRIRNNKRNAALLEKKGRQIEDINMKLQTLNNQLEVRVSERTVQLRDEIAGKEQTEIALKDALKQAENANKIKDTFLSNISHEIRTPMNAIIGLSDLLGKKLKGNDEYNKYIDGIISSSNRLLNLFTNILDYSLLEVNDIKMDLTPCNTRAVVANAADLLSFSANEKGLDLIVRSDNAPAIMADSKSLTKVIADIIDNAVKYTEKGKIEVGADYNSQSNEVCINVSDTGIGIDQQYLPHIFETFSQEQQGYEKNFQGVGIGLPLAKRLIELMNGRIDISSRKGKGTTVRIYFKAAGSFDESKQSIPIDEAFISNEILKESGLQVLITEDDDFNALVLQEIIDRIGFSKRASNAEEAVTLIEEKHSGGGKFDLMIVDINLPGKMDGIELLKKIRNKYSEYDKVPFIAQTAYAMSRDRERLLMSGFDDYISKPIDSDELLAIVKSKLV